MFKILGFKDFKWSFTDSGENFFQGRQNCNNCPEEQIREKKHFVIDQKNAIAFKVLNEHFFLILAKSEKFWPSCWKCNLRILGKIWGKTFFRRFGQCYKLLRTLIQKNTFIRKVFFRVVTTAIRASDKFSEENHFFFIEILLLTSFWSLSNFFYLLAKVSSSVSKVHSSCTN